MKIKKELQILEVYDKTVFVNAFYNEEGKIIRITSELEKGMSVLALLNEIHKKIFVDEKLIHATTIINIDGKQLEIIVD